MATSPSLCVTAQAPVNIAVIKYWGKTDEALILPLNSSLSTTLSMSDLCTTTTIMASKEFGQDRLWLNGREESVSSARIQNCIGQLVARSQLLKRLHQGQSTATGGEADRQYHFHIVSVNNFPTAAGLASSASGFACLTYTLGTLLEVEGDLSMIARLGSGSACRSIYGGFVKWIKGKKADGTDSIAAQVAPETHWPELQILVCVVSAKHKETPSTAGMQTSTETSPFLNYRATHIVEERMKQMEEAIYNRDFQLFGELTIRDSNSFHATCLDTYPPIFYLNDTSKAIINLVTHVNKYCGKIKIAYTFDAGPNAVLYALKEDTPLLLHLITRYFPPSSGLSRFVEGSGLSACGVESLESLGAQLLSQEAWVQGLLQDLDAKFVLQPGSIQRVIHTMVGSGPRVITNESMHLIDIATGLPKK